MTYWCVKQKYFDNGQVKVKVYPVEAEAKPGNSMQQAQAYDHYCDYFEVQEEAAAFAQEAMQA